MLTSALQSTIELNNSGQKLFQSDALSQAQSLKPKKVKSSHCLTDFAPTPNNAHHRTLEPDDSTQVVNSHRQFKLTSGHKTCVLSPPKYTVSQIQTLMQPKPFSLAAKPRMLAGVSPCLKKHLVMRMAPKTAASRKESLVKHLLTKVPVQNRCHEWSSNCKNSTLGSQ